jgi:putative ABC transport system permease protein
MVAGVLNWLSQVASITKVSLQTIFERKGSSGAAVFGIAGVVGVFVGVLSMAVGFRQAMTAGGDPQMAIVLRSGSDSEMMSILMGPETRLIADAPGIARTEEGPRAAAELFVIINLPKRSTGTDANVPLRGVEPAAFRVHDDLKIIQGRRFEPGRNEVIVGVGAAYEFAGLDLDSKVKVGRNEWTVVGLFTANGGLAESEIWTDATVLQDAYQRGNSFQSVYAKLTSPDAFNDFKDSLMSNPQLNVKVLRLPEYFAEQSTLLTTMIQVVGSLITALMFAGATFGALNTMYSAVAARTREIATLRALGFGSGAVVISVMIESLVLAGVGGAVGGGVAYFAFNGFRAATMNWQSFSQVTFAFAVTPPLLLGGIVIALGIGFFGGLLPAIRAARLPVAAALREL